MAAALAWFWPPLLRRSGAPGAELRVPAGWTAEAFPAGSGPTVVRVEGGPWPALVIERHRGVKAEALKWAEALPNRRYGLLPISLGPYGAFRVSTLEGEKLQREGPAAVAVPGRERIYFVFRSGDVLYVASYAAPLRAWDRWRAERTYRRILATLKSS
jgi:hypothetical protein